MDARLPDIDHTQNSVREVTKCNSISNCTKTNEQSESKAIIQTMLYAFFWVILRRLNFICRRFGTLSLLHRRIGMKNDQVSQAKPKF